MNIKNTSFFTAGNTVPFTMHAFLLMQPFHCNDKVSVFVQDFLTDLFYQGGSACIQPSLANSFVTSVWFPPFYPVLKSSLRRSRGQSRFHKSIFHLAIQSWIRNMVVSQQRKSRLYLSPTGIIFSKKKVSQTPEQGFGDTSYLPSGKPLSFDYTVNLCLKHLLT